eukprot:CAMPEP_0202865242 /NCGR_PEP_ID=MMETSP1391-20130828/5425_1 /ASSEMBLY_ACC=CAM_ASM_000867 /TAXON_ID=1034604 /ORGANISM="Chlamydomonas leiostraca, Strain SAG 11-49" /LENGTH=131 /DNA_ID=CAMNT_0049545051 /DNA_START=482 /DNA_END=877 /DNA_ORIENTATION=-
MQSRAREGGRCSDNWCREPQIRHIQHTAQPLTAAAPIQCAGERTLALRHWCSQQSAGKNTPGYSKRGPTTQQERINAPQPNIQGLGQQTKSFNPSNASASQMAGHASHLPHAGFWFAWDQGGAAPACLLPV